MASWFRAHSDSRNNSPVGLTCYVFDSFVFFCRKATNEKKTKGTSLGVIFPKTILSFRDQRKAIGTNQDNRNGATCNLFVNITIMLRFNQLFSIEGEKSALFYSDQRYNLLPLTTGRITYFQTSHTLCPLLTSLLNPVKIRKLLKFKCTSVQV